MPIVESEEVTAFHYLEQFIRKLRKRYIEDYWDSDMKRDFAETVWNCFKSESTELRFILLVVEQSTFLQDVVG